MASLRSYGGTTSILGYLAAKSRNFVELSRSLGSRDPSSLGCARDFGARLRRPTPAGQNQARRGPRRRANASTSTPQPDSLRESGCSAQEDSAWRVGENQLAFQDQIDRLDVDQSVAPVDCGEHFFCGICSSKLRDSFGAGAIRREIHSAEEGMPSPCA